MKRPTRVLWISGGIVCTLLGAIGVVVPGLPTTPLVLLASWCFLHSSPRLQRWLMQSFLGKYVRDYREKGGLTMGKRIMIIMLMSGMVCLSIFCFIDTKWIEWVVGIAGVIGVIVVGFVVPKAKQE